MTCPPSLFGIQLPGGEGLAMRMVARRGTALIGAAGLAPSVLSRTRQFAMRGVLRVGSQALSCCRAAAGRPL